MLTTSRRTGDIYIKNVEVAEGRVAVSLAWKINNIYIINMVRENQSSDYFSPPGL